MDGGPWLAGVATRIATLERVREQKATLCDLVELRADYLKPDPSVLLEACRRLKSLGKPSLFTLRHGREDGRWTGSETDRLAAYRAALPFVSAIDVELRSRIFSDVLKAAHEQGKTVVGSYHHFKKTPPLKTLLGLIREGRKHGADIVKISTMIVQPTDVITLFEALRQSRGGPLCVLGMGPLGVHSRIGLPCAGSCMTYGALERATAPGQWTCAKLHGALMDNCISYCKGHR